MDNTERGSLQQVMRATPTPPPSHKMFNISSNFWNFWQNPWENSPSRFSLWKMYLPTENPGSTPGLTAHREFREVIHGVQKMAGYWSDVSETELISVNKWLLEFACFSSYHDFMSSGTVDNLTQRNFVQGGRSIQFHGKLFRDER